MTTVPSELPDFDQALRQVIRQVVREELGLGAQSSYTWSWLTTKQAAELLGISPHRVAARVREGRLPGRRYGGRVYVDRVELEKQLARRSSR